MGNGSFIPSINVDSCISEEQEDHLVLAIRVPKSTIFSNIALLAAMIDAAGVAVPRVWSTRTDPPSRANRWFGVVRQMLAGWRTPLVA
jgi:hypothetical protein